MNEEIKEKRGKKVFLCHLFCGDHQGQTLNVEFRTEFIKLILHSRFDSNTPLNI